MSNRPLLRRTLQAFVLAATAFFLFAATVPAQKKSITLRDAFANKDLQSPRVPSMKWLPDGKRYLTTKQTEGGMNLIAADAKTSKEELFLDAGALKDPKSGETFSFMDYDLSPTGKYVLFTTSLNQVWRYSTTGQYVIYDLQQKKFTTVPEHKEGLRNVKFSPDETKLGYVSQENLWAFDIASGQETQLTTDGAEHIFNGRFGWVYEEEFSIIDGWQWSPDGKSIAYWQEDERNVPEYTLTDWTPLHGELVPIRYPKSGDANPIMKIGVVALDSKATKWMDIGTETDMYIPRIYWTKDPNTLCILRMNRLQNHLDVLFADVASGSTRRVIEESSSTGWIDIGDYTTFLKTKKQFIWASERSGYNHLYLYDYDGKVIAQITKGEWEVTDPAWLSADEKYLYYMSTEVSPLERHLYKVRTDGSKKERLTPETGYHTITMSPGAVYYTDSWSSVSSPVVNRLCDSDGDTVRTISKGKLESFAGYHWNPKEIVTITTDDGVLLYASIIKPADFDSTRRYPVYFDVYGGPGYQSVTNRWPSPVNQWVANEGFIVFQIDNRGGGARGTAFKHAVYKQLGKWEINDYIQGAKYLATLPYVDKERIGIWGWSYGGYVSALALLLGADYFKAAVAIAPVTDWKFYDTIYAERYMQRPSDNPQGYKVGSCIENASKLKGKLLIIHGGMDDNVHLQNTMRLVDKFEEAGKQFDMRVYPNGNHGVVSGFKSRIGMYEYFMDFLKRNLRSGT